MNLSHYSRKIILLAFVLSVTTILSAIEVKKEYHKEFDANNSSTLKVSNRYGEVIIENWEKNQVVIDVVVKVEMSNENAANEVLSLIQVNIDNTGDVISAITEIGEKFSFKGWGSPSRRFNIDYHIKMPAGATLELENRYGNVEIGDLTGQVTIGVKYGTLAVSSLTRMNEKPLNSISVAYGKANIEKAGWLEITARYTTPVTINEVKAIVVDSRYSKFDIGKVNSVVLESKYDGIEIGTITNLSAVTGYTSLNIENLSGNLELEARYGSFSLTNVAKEFGKIEINGSYCSINMGVNSMAEYRFIADLRYAGLKMDDSNIDFSKKIVDNNSKYYEGIVGKGKSPKSIISIESAYGSVRIN